MTEPTTPAADVLDMLGWLPNGVNVTSAAVAGAGNMNLVERIRLSDGSSLILKRAHGWVEKYPDIPAPIARAGVEAAFYHSVVGTTVGAAMPRHIAFDEAHAANLFEDLGEGTDGMTAYAGTPIAPADLDEIVDWMIALHDLAVPCDTRLNNQAMRSLNAIHIFDFPLDQSSGFSLNEITLGLQEVADQLKADTAFVESVKAIGRMYLASDGGVLLHGDLYPGSWLTTTQGLRIIDPEFCWIGPREWDVGVLAAHLILSGQTDDLIERIYMRYSGPIDRILADKISGIEIMRRLIGVAQLPLNSGLAEKTALLKRARHMVVGRGA
jgi:5-methylthioribose kinase